MATNIDIFSYLYNVTFHNIFALFSYMYHKY